MKSAAFVVIGDEILSGKVKDENIFVLSRAMHERGVRLNHISVIPDSVPIIAKTIADFSNEYDYVCTCGGVGPTHDDKTFLGVATGLALPLVLHEQALEYFSECQRKTKSISTVSDVQKKMLTFPNPCTVHFLDPLWLPLVVVKNVYIFPGVPSLFRMMVTGFMHLFMGEKFFVETMFTDHSETQIALMLKDVQDHNEDVMIGSYPRAGCRPYSVMVTVEGLVEQRVKQVSTMLMGLINGRRSME